MADYIPDSPRLGEYWCPGCAPARDPTREILETRWCLMHAPSRAGPDDAATGEGRLLSGAAEAEGRDCAAMSKLIR